MEISFFGRAYKLPKRDDKIFAQKNEDPVMASSYFIVVVKETVAAELWPETSIGSDASMVKKTESMGD